MAITRLNRRYFDTARWERLNPALTTYGADASLGYTYYACDHVKQMAMFLYYPSGSFSANIYYPETDTFQRTSSVGGTNVNGIRQSLVSHTWSTGSTVGASSLTATAGTTSTITTNQNIQRNLNGWPIHILEGPNAGQTLTITSNTIGANSVITVPTQGSAFSNLTKYRLMTPRWYYLNGSTSFRVYDWATNTWNALGTTGAPTSVPGMPPMTTPSWVGSGYVSYATGTATSATATTLVNSAKTWTSGQWVNFQIRIVSGTGAGQIRTITASDSTSVTVATWTTTPDNTSTYSIESNDDYLYCHDYASTTFKRYSISSNTWTTLSPTVARAAGPTYGSTMTHVGSYVTDPTWNNESAIISGRRIYSMRNASSPIIDYYDIAANTWVNGVATFTDFSPSFSDQFTVGYASIGQTLYVNDPTNGFISSIDLITLNRGIYARHPAILTYSTSQPGGTIWPIKYSQDGKDIWYLHVQINNAGLTTGIPMPIFRRMVF